MSRLAVAREEPDAMARILVVDDNATNRDLIATLAHHAGHATLEAGDGAEALELALASRPDLVICDILMPTMDGYEFVRRLRAEPTIAATPVMFYTANYREREAQTLATTLGVSRILVKPSAPQELLAAIEQGLGHAPQPTPPIDQLALSVEHRRVLTQKLADKAADLQRANERLAVLTELNLQLSAERDAQAMLDRVCRGARELVGARYALSCVQSRVNGKVRQFNAAGLGPGDAPDLARPELDSGIFGDVLRERAARRFTNPCGRAEAVGLPTGFPSAQAGVVVPVMSSTAVYGWLCLLDKVGAHEFTEEDEWLSSAHAAQLGRIFEHRSLLEQLEHRAGELDAEVRLRALTEKRLLRITRARRIAAACNRILVRADDERKLLADMCVAIAHEARDYALAWIGLVHDDAAQSIETVAREGDAAGDFATMQLSWGDNARGQGPIAMALRAGRPHCERFVVPRPEQPPWAEAMLRHGGHAVAALPLAFDGVPLGALCIVSSEPDAFDEAEIELLVELADDIAYGMHTLRARHRQEQTEIGLKASERRFQATFEQSAVGIAHVRADGRFQRVNDKLCQLLGRPRDALLAAGLEAVIHAEDRGMLAELLGVAKSDATAPRMCTKEWRHLRGDGTVFWGQATASAVTPESDEDGYVILVLQDITERKHYEDELVRQAMHDALTGLPNRLLLLDRVEQSLLHARRNGTRVAALMIDLDRFKRINDGIGHASGDAVLREVADRLSARLRASDTAARLGGDEFMVILTEIDDEAVAAMARGLLDAISMPMVLEGRKTIITASVGIAVFPRDGTDASSLLRQADIAMYSAKRSGQNDFKFCAPDLNARMLAQLEMETGLRAALDDGHFELHYQAKVNLRSGAVTGAEALLRWRHPARGLIPPAQFIPLAEDCGLIAPIGAWAIAQACAQMRAWLDAGLPPVSVAVNASARQFEHGDLVAVVARCLREADLPRGALVIELTESTVMANPGEANSILEALREIGVSVSLDDFGTGYSSLSYLRRFPIDSLKIDQSFIRDLPGDADAEAVARLLITLGHSLGLCVIAEGVENQDQLRFLDAHDCDEFQGYHFSRPLPAAAFSELLRRETRRVR